MKFKKLDIENNTPFQFRMVVDFHGEIWINYISFLVE
jgi:hypothetical protein